MSVEGEKGSAIKQARDAAVKSAILHMQGLLDTATRMGEKNLDDKLRLEAAVELALAHLRRGRMAEATFVLEKTTIRR